MNHYPPLPRPRSNHYPPPFPTPYVRDNERYSNLNIVIENLKARALRNGYKYNVPSSNPTRMQCSTKYCTHGLILSPTPPWTIEVILPFHVHPPSKQVDWVRDLPESLIDKILREPYWDSNRVQDVAREAGFPLSRRGIGNMRKCWINRYNPKRKASAHNWDDEDDASNTAHRPPPPKRHCGSSHAGPSNATAFDTAVLQSAPKQTTSNSTASKATASETSQRSPPAPAALPRMPLRATPNPHGPTTSPLSAPRRSALDRPPQAASCVPVAEAKRRTSPSDVNRPNPPAQATHQCARIPPQQDSLIPVQEPITERTAAMTIAHLQSQVAKHEEIIANLRGRITQLEVEKKADATSLAQLGNRIKDLKAEKAQSANLVDRLRTEHQAELERVAERSRAAKAEFNIDLQRVRSEHQAEIDRVAERNRTAAQADCNIEVERLRTEHQAELDRVAERSRAAKAKFIIDLERVRTEQQAELERVAEQTRAAAQAEFNIELVRLGTEHQAELERVADRSYAVAQTELNSEIERFHTQHQVELDRVAALSCATQAECHIMRRLPLLAAKRTKLEAERTRLEAQGARESEIARAVKEAICSFLLQDIEEIAQVQEELEDLLKGVQKRIAQFEGK